MDRQIQPQATVEREFDTAAARERRQMLEKELERFLRILIEEEDPELILLYGSLVSGKIHESSDIDLVVVQDSDQPFFARTWQIRKMLKPQVGADILCYTPDEFGHLYHNRLFFKQEIVGKGKVLYERRRNAMARLCE